MRNLASGARFLIALFAVAICGFMVLAQGNPRSPLPAPTGTYAVGRTSFDWTDESRPDADNPNGHRELMVWMWYPANSKAGMESAEWMPGKWGELFVSEYLKEKVPPADLQEITEKLKQHPLNTIHTHSYSDAPIISGKNKFPLLIFTPGMGVVPLIYTTLLEDLASHGYVVAAVVPTYYTRFTVFSDGRTVIAYRATPPPPPGSNKRTSPDQREIHTHDGQTVYLNREQMQAQMDEYQKLLDSICQTWSVDMAFTLTQLEKLDRNGKSQFKSRFDLKEVGALGHSMGGAASLQMAKDDLRVRAAVNLDGTLFGEVKKEGLFKPLLLFQHFEAKRPPNEERSDAVVFKDGKPSYRLTLAGSTHEFAADFGVLPFETVRLKAQLGTIDPARALAITNTYVEAFFYEYLEGKKSSLLNGPSPEYPEITFETNQ